MQAGQNSNHAGVGASAQLSFSYPSERKPTDLESWGSKRVLVGVVYLFYTVGPTGIDAGGAGATTKPPTNVSAGHGGRSSVWFAVCDPGIPWLQAVGRVNQHLPSTMFGTSAIGATRLKDACGADFFAFGTLSYGLGASQDFSWQERR